MSDATPSSSTSGGSATSSVQQTTTAREPRPGDIWPVYTGKSFNLWSPDTGSYYDSADAVSVTEQLQHKRLSQRRTASSAFADISDSVAGDPLTLPCRRARIAFRDVTNPTNTRTLVTALIPPDRVAVHKAPYLCQIDGSPSDEAYLLGVLCSMPCDWQVRRMVELVMSFEQLRLLCVPDPGQGHPVRDRVVEIAGCLAATDERFAPWAATVGVPVAAANDPDTKAELICELDACVAHLYGLDEDDLKVVYSTFDVKRPDRYVEHHARVLAHFCHWAGDCHTPVPC